ncbi:hypothetical protein BSNK01_23730 [Bacillaceae bacterium]
MKESKRNVGADMFIMFFVSFSLIVYEVFLTRLFAVILDYNFVFLVIALATLGIGLGGYITYRYFSHFAVLRDRCIGLFALSMILLLFLIYLLPFQGIIVYSLLALIPFLLGGFILAGIVQAYHTNVNVIYFADLVGAGTGAAGAVFLLNLLNPLRTVGLLSLLMFFVYYLIRFRERGIGTKLVSRLVLVALMVYLIYPFLENYEFKAYRTSPYTTFSGEPDAKIIFTEWNAFSRTDVYDADDDDFLYITVDGGAVSPISKFSGDLKEVDYLRSTTGFLAFHDQPNERALIIGVGSGQEVLMAQMAGFREIEAVDINKGSFDAVRELSDFSGNPFRQKGVKAIVSDGRNYIRQTKKKYDLIYLSLVLKQSESGLGLSLTENYIFTQEAIAEYMNKLNGRGRLAFLLHDEKELYKILYAAETYFREQGLPEKEIKNRIAVIETYQHFGYVVEGMDGTMITRPLIVIKKEPFTQQAARELKKGALRSQQIPVHIPYVLDRFKPLQAMLQKEKIHVQANRDDMPFFYHKTQGIPFSLIFALLTTLFIASLIAKRSVLSTGQIVYFSGVAVAFMFIEVTLVQRLVLFLGHPTLAFVVVLGVLLVSGGIGSLLATRWRFGRARRYFPLLFTALAAVGVHVITGWYDDHLRDLSQSEKILLIGITLFFLGFFMGMPFPYALSRVRKHQVAISWALNGIMTVAGSLLAAFLSLMFGFTFTLMAGAAIYALLYVLFPSLKW